ncbi:MAG TPA: flagellar export protein FliJ [Longimicrobiales bacterium]|nr:flagellar export protein FliJ [Longimicrobiales bacterium]
MSGFHFRLDTVLALRERKEKDSAVGLAQARREAEHALKAREDLRDVLEAGRTRLAEAHGAGGPAGHLQNLALVLGSVGDQLQDADERCREADERVSASMREYHEAFQQRRTLEQLRSHRLEEWQTEQARGEQKTLDELALTRHGRARAGGAEGTGR